MATKTALQTKQSKIINAFANNVDTLVSILPAHVSPAKLMRTISFEIRQNPALAGCSVVSLMGCVIKACLLGLEVGSAKGHAYLVPFKKEATLIIGYKGFVWLAHNSKVITKIEARAVFKTDTFKYSFGTNPRIEHSPEYEVDRTKDKDVTHVYAVAWYADGTTQFDVMTRGETELIRQKAPSSSASSSPWTSDRETDIIEMRKKTAVRRLAKMLPMSAIQEAAGLDELADTGEQNIGAFLEGEFAIVEEGEAEDETPKGNAKGKAALADKQIEQNEKKPSRSQSKSQQQTAEVGKSSGPQQQELDGGEPTRFEQIDIALGECGTAEDLNKFLETLSNEPETTLSESDRVELTKRAHTALEKLKQEN